MFDDRHEPNPLAETRGGSKFYQVEPLYITFGIEVSKATIAKEIQHTMESHCMSLDHHHWIILESKSTEATTKLLRHGKRRKRFEKKSGLIFQFNLSKLNSYFYIWTWKNYDHTGNAFIRNGKL
ncbi:hypothetical protein OUZ56_022601 [Daphnia magna]|uniref:Uncharacterized protein n=1 Tax=Daphnia magna TaxID=35525 RepID=A0ABR0AWW4_9CRUS|nr:hypothetical protein OUZ56_022601 [Daphnia magna]